MLSVTSKSMCRKYWLTALSSLPRKKSVVRWADHPDMTITVDWDVKNQTNQPTLQISIFTIWPAFRNRIIGKNNGQFWRGNEWGLQWAWASVQCWQRLDSSYSQNMQDLDKISLDSWTSTTHKKKTSGDDQERTQSETEDQPTALWSHRIDGNRKR